MALSLKHRTQAFSCALLLYWFSSTSLSSPAFAETLAYRENSHNDSVSRYDANPQENPYQARREQLRARAALPSPDLLREPVATAQIEPVKPPQGEPMRITIPNPKVLQDAGLPPPELLNAARTEPAATPSFAPPPPAAVASEPRQTVAEFKPMPPQPVSPQQLAELAPAAGPDNNNTPLIALPGATPAPATTTTPTVPAPVPVTVTPTPDAPAPAVSTTDAETTKILDNALKTQLPTEEPHSEAQTQLPSLQPQTKAPDKKPARKNVSPVAKTKPYSPLDSEPDQNLSQASKAMIGRIPSGLDKEKPKPEGPFNIDRSRDMEEIFKPEDAPAAPDTTVAHEAMGIKIEVKNRAPNLDYELEKAYDALSAGQPTHAMEIYKNILTNDPNNKGALFGLATTYHRSGQLDQARLYYSKLLAIAPNHREGLNNFLVLLADEAPQEALGQMEKLAARNPDFSPIPAQMAVIYQKLGESDKAASYMFKAINLAPENLVYRYNLAIMLDKQKKYDEAARLYKQLVEAALRGEVIPGNLQKIQQRLTFISSNRQ